MGYKNISEVYGADSITNDTIVSTSQGTVTACFEIAFSEIDSDETLDHVHAKVMEALTEVPDNTSVNIYFTKTFVYPEITDTLGSASTVINHLEKVNNAAMRNRPIPEYRTFLTVTMPIEMKEEGDLGLFGLLKKLAAKKLEGFEKYALAVRDLAKVADNIKYLLKREMIRLKSDQIVNFMSLLLNKNFMTKYAGMNSLFTGDIVYHMQGGVLGNEPAYIRYGDYYHSVLTQRARFKKSIIESDPDASQMLSFLDYKMANIPFMLHHSITVLGVQDGLQYANRKKNLISKKGVLAQKLAFLNKTPEGIPPDELRDLIEMEMDDVRKTQYARFVRQSFKVHLWDRDLKTLNEKTEEVMGINARNWQFHREREGLKCAWYSSMFPGMEHLEVNPMVISSLWARKFLPIDLPPRCIPHKDDSQFVYYYNEFGELVKYDLFSEKADNWNCQIIGSSGSGKSFTMNNLLIQFAAYNPQIAILDYGGEGAGSYRNFVNIQNGTYLEISLEKGNFSVNPFDGPFYCNVDADNIDGFFKRKLNGLMSTLELMITSKFDNDGPISLITPETRFVLDRQLRDYYAENGNNGYDESGHPSPSGINYCTIHDFAHKKLKSGSASFGRSFKDYTPEALLPVKEKLGEIFNALAPFIGIGLESGVYAPFFRQTKAIKNKDVVCFDMAGLGGAADLKKVLIPVILETIATNILTGDMSRKKMIVMDEAWRDLQGGSMQDYMEDMYRTIRKMNGNISILTQSFSDVLNSKIGAALMKNTSYYYFVGPKHDLPEIAAACRVDSGACGSRFMSDYYIDVIRNSAAKKDFFLFTPFFAGLLHFIPTKEFIMIATTHPKHKLILKKHMEKLGVDFVTPEVLEAAKHEF